MRGGYCQRTNPIFCLDARSVRVWSIWPLSSVSSCVKQYKLALQGALDCELHVRFSRAVGFLVGYPRGYRHQTYSSGSPVTGAARIYHMGICCCSGRRLARATILNTLVINHFWELT